MGTALLINPSYARTYGSTEGGIAFPVYPVLGLSAIAGALEARGHRAFILDLSYRRYDPDLIRSVIRSERPDIIGITATTPLVNQLRDISFLAKEFSRDLYVVGGGPHPAAMPSETLHESALDAVATGEGDFVLADLLDGRPPAAIAGLMWRDTDGALRTNAPAPLVTPLDSLPMPAWHLYPRDSSAHVPKLIARELPVTTVEFSRGCVFSCDFCGSKTTMGRGHRKKSPERCAEELARLEALGFREVVLVDDIFTSDRKWAMEVCEAIIRRGTRIRWTCTNGIRVDSATPELFALMKRAGCYRVYFGFESGNQDVLTAFGKGGRATLQRGVDAVAMARRAGLEPNGFFLVGLTGDTEASMADTIAYARQLPLDTMKCGITIPFPGTPMFQSLRAAGRIKTLDWDRYTVYNRADRIFDHPTLDWATIARYFRRFYAEAYFRNPGFIWRRLVYMLRHRETWPTIFYTLRAWLMLARAPQTPQPERYAYEPLWRPRDTRLG